MRRRSRSARFRGQYRTLCVRTCDGYYFPVSFGVNRGKFSSDARICRSKCGSDAKLYYTSSHAKPKNMVDLQGQRYAKSKTAFLFRKERVKGCSCRPQPWQTAERDRHQMYKLNEPDERRLARLEHDLGYLSGKTRKRKKLIEAEKAARAKRYRRVIYRRKLGADLSQAQKQVKLVAAPDMIRQPREGVSDDWYGSAMASYERRPRLRTVTGEYLDDGYGDEDSRYEPLPARRPYSGYVQTSPTPRTWRRDRYNRARERRRAERRAKRRRAAQLQRRRPVKKKSVATFWGGGSSKPKYRWPGD